MNRDTILAWKYHDLTKHSYWSIRTTPHYLDWANQPSPFKIYPGIEPIQLPQVLTQSGVPALEAVASKGIDAEGETGPSLDQLSSLLYYSAGITKKKTYPGGTIYFRAAACAGALYPVEIYLVCSDIDGLRAGVYHFNPGDFSLRRLREGDYRNVLVYATADEPQVATAPITLVFTAITWRSAWKYRDRSYRYHFWDNGMVAANALAMAQAHRLPAKVVMGFIDTEVNKLLGIDGERELALSLLPLGHSDEQLLAIENTVELPEVMLETIPLSSSQVDYPSIVEMHTASSLATQEEVTSWRDAVIEYSSPQSEGEIIPLAVLTDGQLPDDTIEEVIQRRASTRRFARKQMAFPELSVIIDRATRGLRAVFLRPPVDQLNDIYLIANRVDGLASGAYFYRRNERALELIKPGQFSEKAAYLTLEQELGGDACVTFFFMAALDRLLRVLGNRAYRAVQMEAGVIGGKMYLSAYGLRRGATGLTFYDDDVTEFFSPHAAGKSCIFVMSIGIPGKPFVGLRTED